MKAMRKVWKIGSRWSEWGDPNTKITNSIFYRYNIVFANTHAVLDTRPGHLIALADGYTIVAIGEILSPAQQIEKLGIVFKDDDRIKFFNDATIPFEANDNDSNVCGCIVRFHWLNEKDRFAYNKAGRFFHASSIEAQVNDLFDKLI